jgi:hypothetical protein
MKAYGKIGVPVYTATNQHAERRHFPALGFAPQVSDMKTRELGRQGLKVSELGLGCMGLSDFYSSSRATEADRIAL